MNSSEKIKELAVALCKAQAKMKIADKGSLNPHFKSKYASLEQVWEACREALTSEGLSIVQGCHQIEQNLFLKTVLMHSSGECIVTNTPLYLPSPTMQQLGSAVTYAKRISLMAIAGISVGEVDDDGEENRKAFEQAPKVEPKPDLKEFNELVAQLKAMIKIRDWKDDVLNYARDLSQKTGISGIDILRASVNQPEDFMKEYALYLSKSK